MVKINTIDDILKNISKRHTSHAATFQYHADQGAVLQPIKKLFGNYILEGALTHFPARRGSGKSLLAMQICIAITQEYDTFLGEKLEKHGNCIYLDFEMGEKIIERRAYLLKKNAPKYVRTKGDNLLILNSRKSFFDEFDNIIRLVYDKNPVLIVIDNLRNALKGANLNSSSEMANFFAILYGLKEMYNTSIVLIDHFKKNTNHSRSDSDLQSGSGVKTDLSDADFILRNSCQNKNLRIMKRIKSRLVEESDEAKLIRLNPESLWFELVQENINESEHLGLADLQDKEELKDIIFDMHEKGSTLEEIARAVQKGKSTIHRYLQERKP